jgi:hypothetical protein
MFITKKMTPENIREFFQDNEINPINTWGIIVVDRLNEAWPERRKRIGIITYVGNWYSIVIEDQLISMIAKTVAGVIEKYAHRFDFFYIEIK